MNRVGLPPRFLYDPALQDEIAVLEDRAEQLDVIVSIEQKTGRFWGWLVRVYGRTDKRYVDLRSSGPERGDAGPLLPVVAGALDDFETAHSWTPEELVTIASQSGIPVERA